jgi:hypothetical protein
MTIVKRQVFEGSELGEICVLLQEHLDWMSDYDSNWDEILAWEKSKHDWNEKQDLDFLYQKELYHRRRGDHLIHLVLGWIRENSSQENVL